MTPILIGFAGSAGAATRFMLDGWIRKRWVSEFPFATAVINVTGSLLLGVLTGLVLAGHAQADLRLIAGTGFCGGYTTFSTASFETVRLIQRGARLKALTNGLGTLLLTLGAGAIGLVVTR